MRALLLLICGFVYVIPFYFHYSSHEFDGFEVIFTWLDNGVYRCISVINTRWRTEEEKIKFSYKNPECYVFSFSVFISVFGLETFKLWAEYFVYTTYKTVERQLNRTNESKQEYLQRNVLRITQSSAELTFSQSTILDLNVIKSHFCSQNTQLLQFVFFSSLLSLLSLMLMFL